ncbi:hypothetical protein D9613_009682 [Agrocybe pediades]|uniref:Uncharacterized protein n=1 Tax=Agrocybe pediades TaxID=84607 RepID=A0A8H4QXB2_9AGAR|nr:hypothetical protein D9613_009682 [Agrocybe pediades]
MLIPLFSTPLTSRKPSSARRLSRRKGGGGGGGHSSGGHTSSAGRGGSSGSGKASNPNASKARSGSIQSPGAKAGGRSYTTSTYSTGQPIPLSVIPQGQLFAGRKMGGGSRGTIYGSRTYGSGYPNEDSQRGTSGRDFPFIFWPIAWVVVADSTNTLHPSSSVPDNSTSASYLNTTLEYGTPTNDTRPGGPLAFIIFTSSPGLSSNLTTGNTPSTFYVLSDNTTITSLLSDLSANCTSFFSAASSSSNTSIGISNINSTTDLVIPRPEQVIQYYRASSIALALEGYNNSATYFPDPSSALDSALPSSMDTNLMQCLNETIGLAAPIPDGAASAVFRSTGVAYVHLSVLVLLWLMKMVV